MLADGCAMLALAAAAACPQRCIDTLGERALTPLQPDRRRLPPGMQDSDFDPEGSSDEEAKPAARRQLSEGVQGSTPTEEDDAEVCSMSYTCQQISSRCSNSLPLKRTQQAGLVPSC